MFFNQGLTSDVTFLRIRIRITVRLRVRVRVRVRVRLRFFALELGIVLG